VLFGIEIEIMMYTVRMCVWNDGVKMRARVFIAVLFCCACMSTEIRVTIPMWKSWVRGKVDAIAQSVKKS
jgi:hypothetical protein